MTAEIEYNARSIPPSDVARSFVPPEPHFVRLLSRNHTLIVGPRGSGKTTLLKMLTLRALRNWVHPDAASYAKKISFNAAFIPADIAWGKQIDSLEELNFHPGRKEAAFVVHTLRSIIYAMRQAVELGAGVFPEHLSHLAVKLSGIDEEKFVKLASPTLGVNPGLNTLLGVELALERRLNDINVSDDYHNYTVESFPTTLSFIVRAFNGLIGDDERRWALLFDELEIAPARIKNFLLAGIRSFDERIVVKLAMAPYMEDAGFEKSPVAPQSLHDYHTVQLTYANKDEAAEFSGALFRTTFKRLGIDVKSLSMAFESPDETAGFGRRSGQSRRRASVPDEFRSLANKDSSFRKYAVDRGLFEENYKFSEDNVAKDIRKVLPIVIARDYYLREFDEGRVVANRSRKAHTLYTGYPSIVEITEGNPRAILTLVGPMAHEHLSSNAGNEGAPFSTASQGQAIRRVELLLTSLLQVIPLDIGGFEVGKGLLDFVDQIGRAFEDRLLKRPFSTDYVGTFVLDDNVTPAVVSAVGKALNAGALIHVPYSDGGDESLLRGLSGQRFRLSYALAARYRLLLTLGDRINLSKLLVEMRGGSVAGTQASLFDPGPTE